MVSGAGVMGKELGIPEKLELLIPGFHGYKRKELMREDELLVRRYLCELLMRIKGEVRRLMVRALDGSLKNADVSELDVLWKRLDGLYSRLKNAPAGYAGLFDRIKVREDELETLRKIDYEIVPKVEELEELIKKLGRGLRALEEVWALLDEIEDLVSKRVSVFSVEAPSGR